MTLKPENRMRLYKYLGLKSRLNWGHFKRYIAYADNMVDLLKKLDMSADFLKYMVKQYPIYKEKRVK